MQGHIRIPTGFFAVVAALAVVPAALASGPDDSGDRGFWDMTRQDQRDWIVKAAGGPMWQDIEGTLKVETAVGGVRVTDETLDLEDAVNGWVELDVQVAPRHHLRAAAVLMSFDGKRRLGESLPIGDVNELVSSEIKVNSYELSYRYGFRLGKWVTLAPLIQIAALDVSYDIDAENLGRDWEEDQWLPSAAIGLRAEFHLLPRLQVFGEGKGFTIGSKATYWDAQGGVEIFPVRWFSIVGGYRAIDYDVDWDDVVVDGRFKGPFVGGTFRF